MAALRVASDQGTAPWCGEHQVIHIEPGGSFQDGQSCCGQGHPMLPALSSSALPGMIHRPLLRSNSSHLAPRTSWDRAAVSKVNSKAKRVIPRISRTPRNHRCTSSIWSAGWFTSLATLFGAGRSSFRFPAHRAGLSPDLWPDTVAQLRTASIRPRRREAVSVLSRPDRLQHAQNVLDRNVLDKHGTKFGHGIGAQRIGPLLPVLSRSCIDRAWHQDTARPHPRRSVLGAGPRPALHASPCGPQSGRPLLRSEPSAHVHDHGQWRAQYRGNRPDQTHAASSQLWFSKARTSPLWV